MGKDKKELIALAEKGDKNAQYELAAFVWYEKSAALKNPNGLDAAGECYYRGIGVLCDHQKAVERFTVAAMLGNAHAMWRLGTCYCYGYGVKKDRQAAYRWWQQAVAQGYNRALCDVGDCYAYGWGVAQDTKQAVKLYKEAIGKSVADGYAYMGELYQYGAGDVKRDYAKALPWFGKASSAFSMRGRYWLGMHYFYYDRYRTVPIDKETRNKGFLLIQESATYGYSRAQCEMARIFDDGYVYCGQTVNHDERKALEWALKAAGQGNAKAMDHAAGLYIRQKNMEQERYWRKRASDFGNASASDIMCSGYFHGQPKPDYEKAFFYGTRALEQDKDSACKWYVAYMYFKGYGTQRDLKKAYDLYKQLDPENYRFKDKGVWREYPQYTEMRVYFTAHRNN